jgi:hypothetical protein
MPVPADPFQADAEALAAHYGYDVAALKLQYDRRSFGSFTTTIDGSTDQRDRYRRAWVFAFERRRKEQAHVA